MADREDELDALWAALGVVIVALLLTLPRSRSGRFLVAMSASLERRGRSVRMRLVRRWWRKVLPSVLRDAH